MSGELEEFATFAAKHRRRDFPPHWDPPPRVGYGQKKPAPQRVRSALMRNRHENSRWLIQVYREKSERYRDFRFKERRMRQEFEPANEGDSKQ